MNPVDDKKSLFWSLSMGDFALCVNVKFDVLCGRISFEAEIRSASSTLSPVKGEGLDGLNYFFNPT